jgi:nitrogen fixation NifU-like protein
MEYTKETLDHFMNPRNMGEIKDADATAEVGNMRCGDIMKIMIKVTEKDGKEVIDDIKFQTLGCAAAIASSSMMTELVKGKTLDEALEVSRDDINKALGTLPPVKYHCSILSADAIHDAIKEYKEKKLKA